MPLHVAPFLRVREEALEAAGLLQVIDSVSIVQAKTNESTGKAGRVVPHVIFNYVNTRYAPRETAKNIQ